jgi:hypothetical protein
MDRAPFPSTSEKLWGSQAALLIELSESTFLRIHLKRRGNWSYRKVSESSQPLQVQSSDMGQAQGPGHGSEQVLSATQGQPSSLAPQRTEPDCWQNSGGH